MADVKAEVAAAVVDLDERVLELVMEPRLRGLDRRVAAIAVPGSQYYDVLVERVRSLVANDQYAALNEPDIRNLMVESVRLRGSERDYATVIVCQVSNVLLIKSAESSPVPGRSIPVGGTGELTAYRITNRMQRTENGWRLTRTGGAADAVWEGEAECPGSL